MNFNTIGVGYPGGFHVTLAIFILWCVFWKGLALWHSAQRKQPWWFAIMLVVNTAGILEIVYLFAVIKLTAATLFSSHQCPVSSEAHAE